MVRKLIGAVALGATVFTACGGTDPATTTTTGAVTPTTGTTVVQGSVIFGEGSLPGTVPAAFPIPEGANIGTTLQDTETGRTEFVLILPAEADAVVDYYEQNLPNAGFEVVRSEAESPSHVIEFAGGGVDGEIRIGVGSSNAATAAIILNPTG